jgi:hypothetical protein
MPAPISHHTPARHAASRGGLTCACASPSCGRRKAGAGNPPSAVSVTRVAEESCPMPATISHHTPARRAGGMPHRSCDQIITLVEKVDALERWRSSTESDLKEIREIISQVKLLMSLSIGGGGLSVLTLIITLILLVTGTK